MPTQNDTKIDSVTLEVINKAIINVCREMMRTTIQIVDSRRKE